MKSRRGAAGDLIFTTLFSLPTVLVVPPALGFLMVSLAPPTLSSPTPASATGVYIPYLGVTMNTSSFAGRFDFGIGMKSLRSPELELSGRKWEDGCSNNNEGFFFLHSRAFLVTVLLVMGEVAGLVVDVVLFVDVVEGCLVVVVVRFVVVLLVAVVD